MCSRHHHRWRPLRRARAGLERAAAGCAERSCASHRALPHKDPVDALATSATCACNSRTPQARRWHPGAPRGNGPPLWHVGAAIALVVVSSTATALWMRSRTNPETLSLRREVDGRPRRRRPRRAEDAADLPDDRRVYCRLNEAGGGGTRTQMARFSGRLPNN
jgi:hypothetical protein